ncbi:MAG: PHP domain-containing protein, partial [Candidatus Peribacteraceae bacterium]|nr:PHP domain-containing protein [Candidatus Peribacteraceae bacterium]
MIQLKLRTEYSFGQTFASVDRIAVLGYPIIGIVDSSTWGHVAAYNACEKAQIQSILGVESIVSDSDSTLKMWFLARNTEGLSELYRAVSRAHQQRLGASPRLFRSDISAMSDNIIKFAGEITDAPFLKEVDARMDLSPASMILNARKKSIASTHGLPLVSVSDNSYLT